MQVAQNPKNNLYILRIDVYTAIWYNQIANSESLSLLQIGGIMQTLELLYETLSEQTDPMLFESPELDQQFQEVEQFFPGDEKQQIRASDTLCSLIAGCQKKAFAVGFQSAVDLLTK